MNKNVGSRQAEMLAKKKYGPRAYAMRSGRTYSVGTLGGTRFGFGMIFPKGQGASWEKALTAAGIRIPAAAPHFPAPATMPEEDSPLVGM